METLLRYRSQQANFEDAMPILGQADALPLRQPPCAVGQAVQRLEWEQVHGHPVYFAETYVGPLWNQGNSYDAASCVWMEWTAGRGKDAPALKANRSTNDVLGIPLNPHFRCLLQVEGA